MKINNIEIYNFRSIQKLNISFQDLMVFIGRNNAGKSNILASILFFFNELSICESDKNNIDKDIYVEVEFNSLSEEELEKFKGLVFDKKLKVRRYLKELKTDYYCYGRHFTQDYLLDENINDFKKRENIVDLPFVDDLPNSGIITKEQFINARDKYIENNLENLNFEIKLKDFSEPRLKEKNIFGKLYFIPALKDTQEEFNLTKKSFFNRIYEDLLVEIITQNDSFNNLKSEMETFIQTLAKNSPTRPQTLNDFENKINEDLEQFWDTKLDVKLSFPPIDEVVCPRTQILLDDGVITDITSKGNGLQRSLLLSLIKVYAELYNESENKFILIIEEPELYLHPQAERELFDVLKDLAEKGNQIYICSHSSSFISLNDYKSICIVDKCKTNGTYIKQVTNDLLKIWDSDISKKKKIANFNLQSWINPERAELFFAEKVILVEGPTEKICLPFLAKEIECFNHKYTIIDCSSKDNILFYVELLNNFKINYVVVYDKDNRDGRTDEQIKVANKSSKKIEEKINNDLGFSIIFENDIEEELDINLAENNKPFKAMQYIIGDEFKFSDKLKEKIKKIYC